MTSGAEPPFWEWSLARYEIEGVAPRLLHLQDNFGLNVNILLWCGWCAERYRDLPEIAVRKAIDLTARWSGEVVGALRTARRLLKHPPPQADADSAQSLRAMVRDAELAAEKIEQRILNKLAAENFVGAEDAAGAESRFRRNLAIYAALAGAPKLEGFSVTLLDELAARILVCADPPHSEND